MMDSIRRGASSIYYSGASLDSAMVATPMMSARYRSNLSRRGGAWCFTCVCVTPVLPPSISPSPCSEDLLRWRRIPPFSSESASPFLPSLHSSSHLSHSTSFVSKESPITSTHPT